MDSRESSLKEEQLLSVLDICRRLSAQRDLPAFFDFIAREAARLLESDRATIFLLDRVNCELWSKVALGTDETLRFDARLGLAGDVALNRSIVRIEDAYEDDRFNPAIDALLGYRTRSVLAVPLINEKGESVGAFQVLNKTTGAFTEEDVRLLAALARHAAVAAETAELVDRLKQERDELASQNRRLKEEFQGQSATRRILGTSAPMQRLVRQIEEVAPSEVDILITGESGTGKELVARALHRSSSRSEGPLLALNCASLPENLVEAELFGIDKGVATGVLQRPGKFEAAGGGTLFLDEIGDLSLAAQAKILRALQERTIERVGGRQPIRVDVRVVAATNKDLEQEIEQENFRDDLYYRLKVIHLRTPALREIREDIPMLAEYFLGRYCRETGRPEKILSAEALDALLAYSWPGNVRELENEMTRLAVTGRRREVRAADLSENIFRKASPPAALKDVVEELERRMIREALAACEDNRARAARTLGLSRQGLLKKMQRYGIE